MVKIPGKIWYGIGLFILGLIGVFYLAGALFTTYGAGWYTTVIISLVASSVGLVLLWKK